jgi:hypothetical protein
VAEKLATFVAGLVVTAGVGVGVGVGVDYGQVPQYLPPVFNKMLLSPCPPQTII